MHAAEATIQDIAAFPGTQIVNFGTITQNINLWVNSHNPAFTVTAQASGCTLFRGTVNGSEVSYIWVGGEGTYGIGNRISATADFLLLPETVIAGNQDNIDIKKTFTVQGLYDIATILAKINNLAAYTVSDKQSVWFVGRDITFIEGGLGTPIRDRVTNPLTLKYKMLNKGRGAYGAGQIQLTSADIELVYSNEASLNDLEVAVETDVIAFTLSEGQTISQWLNIQNPALLLQPQEEGYTIFKSTGTDAKSYLWIGTAGIYGNGNLQSVTDQFQLLNEAIIPVNQDNIDFKKSFTIPNDYTTATILSAINGLRAYEVKDTHSVWFTGRQRTPVQVLNPALPVTVSNPLILKYKMLNKGKGWYGQGGIALTSADIELVYTNEATLEDLETGAETQVITFTLTEGQTVSQWLNSYSLSVAIQSQEEGYTIFKGTVNSEEISYLWIGVPGTYGNGHVASTEADFQQLNDVAPAPFMPAYAQVLSQNNRTTQYAIHSDEDTDATTAYGADIKHTGSNGESVAVSFEEPIAAIKYSIPAKQADDVFAMISDIHKPVKIITSATQGFADGTYTLQVEDRDKWLVFKITADFNVKIPQSLFPANTLIEGETADVGQATFVGNGITLFHGASENPKTAETNSVFGLKFRSAIEVSLYGKLELR